MKELAAGGHHTLLLTREGAVYGWGSNAHGQLGLQNEDTAQVRQVYTTALVLQQGGSNRRDFQPQSALSGSRWKLSAEFRLRQINPLSGRKLHRAI